MVLKLPWLAMLMGITAAWSFFQQAIWPFVIAGVDMRNRPPIHDSICIDTWFLAALTCWRNNRNSDNSLYSIWIYVYTIEVKNIFLGHPFFLNLVFDFQGVDIEIEIHRVIYIYVLPSALRTVKITFLSSVRSYVASTLRGIMHHLNYSTDAWNRRMWFA